MHAHLVLHTKRSTPQLLHTQRIDTYLVHEGAEGAEGEKQDGMVLAGTCIKLFVMLMHVRWLAGIKLAQVYRLPHTS